MDKDIFRRGNDTYQIISIESNGEIEVTLIKNGHKVFDYSGTATAEVAYAFSQQLGMKLLNVIENLVKSEVNEGKFDQIVV